MSSAFIDLHCHPQMKPYGISFDQVPAGKNTSDIKQKSSIWYYDPPTLVQRVVHMLGGILRFRQADMTTLALGNVQIIGASLYPIEKGFFNNELGEGRLSDLALQFITSVGRKRIDYIQDITNYFEDLCREYEYYRQLNGQTVQTNTGAYSYRVVKDFSEIVSHLSATQGENKTVFVIITIEGLHALISDLDKDPDEGSLLNNLSAIKKWEHPPFFVTYAHHFYNHLCGSAKSLDGIVAHTCDQSDHLNAGFTSVGEKLLHGLLDKENGRRILIDIKHMSALSRKRYYEILATDYSSEQIPVIASHAACNGLRSMDEPVTDAKDTAPKMLALDINFYDNEILLIARTGGLFCLQLDERRIGSEEALKEAKRASLKELKPIRDPEFMDKVRYDTAELLWNQVQHVLELLDRHNLFAWDCLAIGSDFDGIINPLDGYLTAEFFGALQQNLEKYAADYMKHKGTTLNAHNRLAADKIAKRIFYDNAFAFLKKWF